MDTFFGALPAATINALPIGAVVTAIYDHLGARRPRRYLTVTGTVRRVLESSDRGPGTLFLEDVRTVRPDGEVTDKPSTRLDYRNITAVNVT